MDWPFPTSPALALLALLGVFVLGLAVFQAALLLARRLTGEAREGLFRTALDRLAEPGRLLFPVLMVALTLPGVGLGPALSALLRQALSLAVIAALAWLLSRLVGLAAELVLRHYKVEVEDNLLARRAHTQIGVIRKIAVVIVWVVALAAMLMVFDRVRQLGASILASAGIAGIIIGLAAQRSIGALLAGLQVALTQPVRIDDVVVVEGEWGRIEEITLTYVVVRIWDQRRLILPMTYFIEEPFQNWTRVSAELLGTVNLHLDYSVPLEPLRRELEALLSRSPLWDGRVWSLQVVGASERTMELRALMSAKDASAAWNLRCEIREGLITFIREKYPRALPRLRAELEGPVPGRPD